MIRLRPLGPSALTELAEHITRTPNSPDWITEVESCILDWGPAAIFRARSGQVLLIEHGGSVIGAAIHRPSEFRGAERLAAVLLDHRSRGVGRGEDALRASIAEAHRASGLRYVMWQVHKDNAAMQHLSRKVVEPDAVAGDYHVFVHEQ